MDYNFSTKHTAHRKWRTISSQAEKMSFGPQSSMKKSYSTGNNYFGSTVNENIHMNTIMNFISGLHSRSPSVSQTISKSSGISQHKGSPSNFSKSSAISLSCIASSFVRSDNQFPGLQHYCDGILIDVFLNHFTPFDTMTNQAMAKETDLNPSTPKRTYADVTKTKPKARISLNNINKSNVSSNNDATLLNSPCHESLPNHVSQLERRIDLPKTLKETNTVSGEISFKSRIGPQKTTLPRISRVPSVSSTSSNNPCEARKFRSSRSLSECSVDSEDSFILFQNDDENTVCDSDDESCDDEVCFSDGFVSEDKSPPVQTSKQSSKKVRFKPDGELVSVRRMIVWDYALRAARPGPWEQYVRDRVRFAKRIRDVSTVISPILESKHREYVYKSRKFSHLD